MAQYQSFPGVPGDSRTLEKLKGLRLPPLNGKRFLDVGCNEGFFCGYAAFEGAEAAVGLDISAEYIARARQRFLDCEFLQQGWDRLPEGPFDVIVLASALHYADDQAALIHSLVSKLSMDGVLVLELGVMPSAKAEWVKVKRGIDERYFPSMPMLKEVLSEYAWKWMGPSIRQDGDPVSRHVVHIHRLRPKAYLLMQPPAYGKSSIARALFERADVPVLSGDEVIRLVVQGKISAPPELTALLSTNYSPYRLDEIILSVFEAGLGSHLVKLWLAQQSAGGGDFAVDAYVPEQWHGQVESVLSDVGYMPIRLQWERVGLGLTSEVETARRADAFYDSLSDGSVQQAEQEFEGGAQGFVDDIELSGRCVRIRGWAVDKAGRLPRYISVRVAKKIYMISSFERQMRPDVQSHLALRNGLCGYTASLVLERDVEMSRLLKGLEVRVGDDQNDMRQLLPMAGALVRKLRDGAY